MNILFKLIFYFKNPAVAVIFSRPDSDIIDLLSVVTKGWIDSENISFGIKSSFSPLKRESFLIDFSHDELKLKDIEFLLKRSSVPILIVSGKDPDPELLHNFPRRGCVITDAETAKVFKKEEIEGVLISGVGFDERSDLWASDLNIGEETNFKINHEGDSVPFWIDKNLSRDEITEILLAVRAGMALGLNLVQISRNLKV